MVIMVTKISIEIGDRIKCPIHGTLQKIVSLDGSSWGGGGKDVYLHLACGHQIYLTDGSL